MTKDELFDVVQRIAAHWPHSDLTSEHTVAIWWETLQGLDRDHVVAAVEALNREGREHAPSDGMVLKRATELALDAPDWATASRQLRNCLAFGTNVYVGGGEWADLRQARLQSCPLSVQQFVEHVGWDEVEGWDHADTASEAQLRTKWERFVQRAVEDSTLQGLPSGGLRRLERVNREPRSLGDVLGQLGAGS